MLQLHNADDSASVSLWTDLYDMYSRIHGLSLWSVLHELSNSTNLSTPDNDGDDDDHHYRMLQLRLLLPQLRGLRPALGDPSPHLLFTADLDLADCVRSAGATGARVADMEAVAETDKGYMRGVREGREGVHLWDVAECDGMTEDA
jgi:hypothetical protein